MYKLNHYIIIFFISISSSIADDILIDNARSRPPIHDTSAIYFDIINNTEKDINLISAGARLVAKNVFLRNSYVDTEGVGRTANINKILIPSYTKISFKPQGLHIVISNFKKTLKIGDEFLLKLRFDNEYTKTFKVVVKSLRHNAKT